MDLKDKLRGYKSLKAFNTFTKLMYGISIAHFYMNYREFMKKFAECDNKEEYLKDAIEMVELSEDEVLSLVYFEDDANGIPYNKESLRSLDLKKIKDILLRVCVEMANMDVFF